MEWEVSLNGDESDLRMLKESSAAWAFQIIENNGQFYLVSLEFESLADANQIREKAEKVIELVSGAARLELQSRTPISVGGVSRRHPDGRKDAYMFPKPIVGVASVLPPTVILRHADGKEEIFRPGDPVRSWVEITLNDKAAETVLRFLNLGLWNWVNLYRIYEAIESDCKVNGAIVSQGWATTKAINLFTRTANSLGAVDIESRHGKESTTPPPNPMAVADAKALVLGIARAWLNAKLATP